MADDNPYLSLVQDAGPSAMRNLVSSLDENPDDAARSIQIGQAAGVSPVVVDLDRDNFERQLKINVSAGLVQDNPRLQAYLNSTPLAAKVSHDDLANLDYFSQALSGVGQQETLKAAVEGFTDAFKGEGEEFQKFSDWMDKNPVFGNVFIRAATKAGAAGLDLGLKTIQGTVQGLAAGVGAGLHHGLGMNEAEAARLTRDLIQGAQVLAPELVTEGAGAFNAMKWAQKIEPYIGDGKVPPVGLDPIIDEAHRENAQTDLEKLQEQLKAAVATQTRERAPELVKLYAELHGATQDIEISADAVRALYGDKPPAADDGLLGWVPKLTEQLEAGVGDIHVPLSDYLAKVDPAVSKQIEEFIRMRPDGMTVAEAKEPIPNRPADNPIDAVREAAGLNEVPRARAKQLELPAEGTTRLEDQPVFSAALEGLTKKQAGLYEKEIARRTEQDREFLQKKLEEQEAKRQSRAYAQRKIDIRPEVVDDLNTRPEIILDEALREGKITLNPDKLTDEQKAIVPKEWLDRGGYSLHDLADAYGSDIGLGDRVIALNAAREAAGMRPHIYKRRLIDLEINRRVESEFKANNLDEMKDYVLSQTQEQMLHEQTLALAEEAGQKYPIDPARIKEKLIAGVQRLNVKQVTRDKFLAEAGRAGRAMEAAHNAGNPAEAFRQSQRQQLAFLAARYAKDVEKAVKEYDRLTSKYAKREVNGTAPEYTNAIHTILQKLGEKIGRTPEDLTKEMTEGGVKSLEDFVDSKNTIYNAVGVDLPVADFLLDDKFKKNFKELTAWELLGVRQSLKVLDKFGRDELTLTKEGETFDRKTWIKDAIQQLKDKFGLRDLPVKKEALAKVFGKQTLAAFHSLETVFTRFDGQDPKGMFTKMFTYPATHAVNEADKLARVVSKEYRALGDLKNPTKEVPHSFIEPANGKQFQPFTRETLDAIISNIGNKYNLDRMAYTLGLFSRDEKDKIVPDTDRLLQWVEKNSTPEDITRAQERGKIFNRLKGRSDVVYRNLYGIAPEDIRVQPFAMHGREWEGWYHPIIQDAERAIRDHQAVDTVTKPTSFWPASPNGYTKRRTGAYERLSLHMGEVPLVLNQMVHDIAVRDFVYNTAKIINDGEFRQGITNSYGKEYHDLMKHWLYNIAGNASYNRSAIETGTRVSNFFRQNAITTYVAFNIGTVMKHAPTAAIMSMREMNSFSGAMKFVVNSASINAAHMAHSVMNFFGRDPALAEDAWEFTYRNLEEIQRRDRNWMDTMGGAHDILYGKNTWRNRIMQWGAKAVALSDMASAVPLGYTKYHEVLAETGSHAQAVNEANLAIRNAHGSTSVASRPVIASAGGALAPWFTSLYGFFGANMQRKIELMHDLNDTYKLAKEGEIKKAASNLPGITASTLAYVVFPALVEEWVTGQTTDDRRGYGQKALGLALLAMTNSIVGLRDFTWGYEHGQEPGAGLISSFLHDMIAPPKDLGKPRPFSRQNIGKLVQDGLTGFGDATGMMPRPIAKATRFGVDVYNHQQNPRTLGDWYRGLYSGHMRMRVER